MARRLKHKTPQALLESNVTPLHIPDLTTYVNMVFDRMAELESTRSKERGDYFSFIAGTRATPIVPRLASTDAKEIDSQLDRASDGLIKIVRNSLRYTSAKTKLHTPSTAVDKNGISRKARTKVDLKVKTDYKDDPHPHSRVVDRVRCTILAATVSDIQILSEIFRPCAMPDVIRFKNDFAYINMERGNIRRLHINARIPESSGHVGEIFVYDARGYEFYQKSREAYGQLEGADRAIARASTRRGSHEALAKANKLKTRASHMRKNANDAAGSPPEIRDLLLNQQLYLINDFPVVVVDSKYDNQRFALVVNPTTGFWETDQRFLEIVDNPGDFLVDRFVSGYDIAIRAQAIAESAELRQQLVP